ncbi:MAG TPA: helix-turn-helix transcriptional regulator [Oligella sp.]|nr:helix-turn-helix transcriptional regulator [Oligella sp.]
MDDLGVSFNDLISAIYEEPLAPNPWQQLGTLRKALEAQDVYLVLRQPTDGNIGLAFFDGPFASASPHAAYYSKQLYTLDPFLNLQPNKPVFLSDIIDDKKLLQLEYYRLALAPDNIFHMLGVNIRNEKGLRANLRVTRNRSQPPFGEVERRLCEDMIPHLARALQIYNRISELESERMIYADAMTQLAMATIFLDERRGVFTTNPAADYLLAQKDGFGVLDGLFHLESPMQHRQLCVLIDEVVQSQRSGEVDLARALLVNSKSGKSQYSLIVRSMPPSERPESLGEPVIALFISSPDQPIETSTDLLQELFKLTPAEAKLAVLLTNGFTIENISAELGISAHTVRAHLRSIFSKTHVSRQSELIRLILSSAASLK